LAIQLLVKGKKVPSLKRNPRTHQQEAIAASKQYFLNDKNTRGKLIMPCGTGKSLTAYWITQTLASKATIIAVPSLALIKQSLEDWTKEMLLSKTTVLPDWCCICSDESTGQLTDDFVTDTYSLGIPTTTNEDEITSFLKRKTLGGKIIFTTYQSADKLAQVSKRLKFKFDLAILDEAHKTVGAKDKAFSILLQEDKINISKRLFMTATERIVKGADDEVLSMDDDKVYGSVFYKLSFKKAIEDGIITDYKIVTVLVNDTEIQDLIKKNKYLTDQSKKVDEAEAQMLTTAIALKKAIKEYNLNHTVSFHKSINASKEFQSLYQIIDTNKDSPTVFHISSKLNAGARAELLKDFRNTSNAIITNARCLTEGVDVPAIDCVLFADQKQSVVDIVQASGRALRQYTDKNTGVKKEVGYIIIPVVLKEGESLDDLTESSRFKTVTRIVTSLSTQDETIAEELKLIESGKQKTGSDKIQVIGTVTKSIKLNLTLFSLKISTKIWERIAKANWLSFEEARAISRSFGFTSYRQWLDYSKNKKRPLQIPFCPDIIYSKSGWTNWADWLGHDYISTNKREFKPYELAKSLIQSYKLENVKEWNKFNKTDAFKLLNIPSKPQNSYKYNGWVDWATFLGNKNFNKKNYNFYPFEEAKNKVLLLKLRNNKEWRDYIKRNLDVRIPNAPDQYYKNNWISWGDWLGTNKVSNILRNFRTYEEAKNYVRSLNIRNETAWRNYSKSNKKPLDIPASPSIVYKNSGWTNWADWLGVRNQKPRNIKSLPFLEAREFVRNLNLKSYDEWIAYTKSGIKPENIPSNPNVKYKNDKWISFVDWIGTKKIRTWDLQFLTYNDSIKKIHLLKLSSRAEYTLWWRETGKNLEPKLPAKPYNTYKNKGWISWPDWLGSSK